MPRLTILKGLPGSGKSTVARETVAKTGNTIRVNRDDLRKMLHGGLAWSKERERRTVDAELAIAETALEQNINVVVDDTNILGKGTSIWGDFGKYLNNKNSYSSDGEWRLQVEIKDMTSVPIDVCIDRDRLRTGKERVGRGVIERMALFGGLIDLSKEDKVAVIDIDGTLSNLDYRLWHLQAVPKDYDGFFRDVPYDLPFPTITAAVRKLSTDGYYIIILSGRPTTVGFETDTWLRSYVPFNRLFMRQGGDHRPDDQVKRQLMEQMFRAGLRKEAIKVIIDDRDSVCDVWTEMGLPLIQVDHGTCIKVSPYALEMLYVLKIPINGASSSIVSTSQEK